MTLACPDCEATNPQSYPVPVDIKTFVEHAAALWPTVYDGIDAATAVEENGVYGLNLEIDQTAYGTKNFFQHRNAYACRTDIELRDIEPGFVAIRFLDDAVRTITAFKCSSCTTVWDQHVGPISTVSISAP